MTKTRNSAIDLLKVLSIYFIILHHYALWSGWNFAPGYSMPKLAAQTLLVGGKLGVDVFVMITGYFVIKSHAKVKSLVTIWVETTLISLLMYFVTIVLHVNGTRFSLTGLMVNAFPVLFGRYWFVTAYTLLYLSIPILNCIFLKINNAARFRILAIMFMVLSIVPYVFYQQGMTFSWPVWFVFLYLTGAYLRLNSEKIKLFSKVKLISATVCLFVFGILVNFLLQLVFANTNSLSSLLKRFSWSETVFYTHDVSPLMFIMAILIFCLVMQFTLKPKPWLQYTSRAAFGVYLCQSAPVFSTYFLWPILINAKRYTASWAIVGYGLLSALVIFGAGLIIYGCLFPLRQLLLRLLNPLCESVQKWFDQITLG